MLAMTTSTDVTALDDCTMAVMPAPISSKSSGLVTDESASMTNWLSVKPDIEPDIISSPTNTRPKDATRLPAVFTLLFLVTIVNIRPMSVKSMAYIITLNWLSHTSQPVMVVPMLAPIITAAACVSVITPALTKPTTITVVTDDDCTMAVARAPTPTPAKRLPAALLKSARSLLAESFSILSPRNLKPSKKTPSPTSSKMTLLAVSKFAKSI